MHPGSNNCCSTVQQLEWRLDGRCWFVLNACTSSFILISLSFLILRKILFSHWWIREPCASWKAIPFQIKGTYIGDLPPGGPGPEPWEVNTTHHLLSWCPFSHYRWRLFSWSSRMYIGPHILLMYCRNSSRVLTDTSSISRTSGLFTTVAGHSDLVRLASFSKWWKSDSMAYIQYFSTPGPFHQGRIVFCRCWDNGLLLWEQLISGVTRNLLSRSSSTS